MRPRTIIISVIVLLFAGLGAGILMTRGHEPDTLALPGVVEIQEVRVGSKIGGRIADVLVSEGDLVEPGTVLARFDCPELRASREQAESRLRAAAATLEKAKNGARAEEKDASAAALRAAEARLARMKQGWREEEIRQAQADLDAAQADQKLSADEFARIQRLFSRKDVSASELDAARANKSRSDGRHAAARALLDKLQSGNRKEDIEEATANYREAEARHRLLLAGTRAEDIAAREANVRELEARVRELDANLAECEIRAPDKAVVDVISVRKGDLVAPNQPIMRVLRAADLWVKVFVPETELGKVRLGQHASVTIDSYPDRPYTGTVIQVASISEFTPRNVQSPDERRHQVFGVKVRVDDPAGVFKAGMAATVTLPLH